MCQMLYLLRDLTEQERIMLRRVWMVDKNWYHPKDSDGEYIPMLETDVLTGDHFQLYTELKMPGGTRGIPVSSVFENIETLAHWLTNNDTPIMGTRSSVKITYEDWLKVCMGIQYYFQPTYKEDKKWRVSFLESRTLQENPRLTN
jgi:hypothetical protein